MFATPGDYNGDGIDDIAVTVSVVNYNSGLDISRQFSAAGVYILFGRTTWPAVVDLVNDADVIIKDSFDYGGTLHADNGGDIDGDGVDDLILSYDPIDFNGMGSASLYFGNSSWSTASPPPQLSLADADVTITTGVAGDQFGASVAGIGDFTGDGRDDFAILREYESQGSFGIGSVYIFAGRDSLTPWPATITNPGSAADFVLMHDRDLLGYSVLAAGNVAGDNRTDLLVTGPHQPFTGISSFFVEGGPAPTLGSGASTDRLLPLGDVDGDGYDDLGASSFEPGRAFTIFGEVENAHRVGHIYLGSALGPDFTRPDLVLETSNPNYLNIPSDVPNSFLIGSMGDIDGDGRSELALADAPGGVLHVFRGEELLPPETSTSESAESGTPFEYDLATPLLGTQSTNDGLSLLDPNPDLASANVLLGTPTQATSDSQAGRWGTSMATVIPISC